MAVAKAKVKRKRAARLSPEQRRKSLLQYAIAVCAERGIASVGHTEIAAEAHVSIPTVFRYFPTKADLDADILTEVHRFLIEDIVSPHLNESVSAKESVMNVLLAFTRAIDEKPNYIRIWLEWSASVRDGVWNLYLEFYEAAVGGMAHIVKRGQDDGTIRKNLDPKDAARITVGFAHIIAHMNFSGNTRSTIEHTIDSLVAGYLAVPSAK